MKPPEVQREEVIEEFGRRRTRQLLAVLPAVLAVLLLATTNERTGQASGGLPANVVAIGCLVVVLAVVGFSLVNWRCPACRAYLGKGISPRFCQRCGAALQR
ncbi:MAG: hypothetical protein IT204_02640 [Fimbriimonadaceae bacterium]|nr:hypothetical protein [Fimbriimonadaceae bacterium]